MIDRQKEREGRPMLFLSNLMERYSELSHYCTWFAAYWLIQSSLLIAAGLIAAKLMRKSAAMQSAIYRTTLAAVMLCPRLPLLFSDDGRSRHRFKPAHIE